MVEKAAIIGFGEAGRVFCAAVVKSGFYVSIHDKKMQFGQDLNDGQELARSLGLTVCDNSVEAVSGANLILSTVTASETMVAARSSSKAIREGAIYVDLNSTSPQKKQSAANAIEGRGAHFVDGVAMDTVPAYGAAVPIFVSGPAAQCAADILNPIGFDITVLDGPIGAASTIKMMRSVIVKGIEALMAEAFLGSERAGVTVAVLASLERTYPGFNWPKMSEYHLRRMAQHGKRRAAEMRESGRTLLSLGVEPFVTNGIAQRQQWAADLELSRFLRSDVPTQIVEYVAAVHDAESARIEKKDVETS